MRQVLSISLPGSMIKNIKKKVKNEGFNSVSEYFKYLFRMDTEDVISEKEILIAAKQAEEDYKKGKLKKLNSLSDLI